MKYLRQILGNTKYSKVYTPLTWISPTNSCHSHFSCQLLMLLVGLWSFLGQILDTLPLGQRQKINQIHFLIGGRIQWGQESFGPIFVTLLFYGGDTVCLEIKSQISLAFLFSPLRLFLLLFFPCFFLQFFLLYYFCLFPGLALKLFLFFLLLKQGFHLSVFSG